MELNDVILGFLDWKQMTGYELKGLFEKMDFLPWSGNNNQIYKSLIELEKEGLVEKEVVQQESYPAQKRYRATEAGSKRLNAAVKTLPEETSIRNDFLLHLMWSNILAKDELLSLIAAYQSKVETLLAMSREKTRRKPVLPERTEREAYIFGMILQNEADMLQNELNFLVKLRNGLSNK